MAKRNKPQDPMLPIVSAAVPTAPRRGKIDTMIDGVAAAQAAKSNVIDVIDAPPLPIPPAPPTPADVIGESAPDGERISRRAAHEIPDGMRFEISPATGKPIQKLGAADAESPRARLVPELIRRRDAGQLTLPGTVNSLAADLAWARRRERTDLPTLPDSPAARSAWLATIDGRAQAKSTRESIGRARKNALITLPDGRLDLI